MKKEQIIEDYKLNYKKLERVVKELNEIKTDYQRREEQHELYYKLQDKKITIDEYNTESEILKDKEETEREKRELLTIEEKLLQDNENILINKIIMLIYNNIIFGKYNNIGEKTTEKIDAEIKEYLKDIFNDKYFNIVQFNEWQNYQPNQFINLWKNNDWSVDYYDKKLCFYLTSRLGARDRYNQQELYFKNNVLKYNEYSKTLEEIKADNLANQNRIEKTEIVRDTKRKAKEIYKAYKKKQKTLEELRQKEEQTKKDFDATIKNNQDGFYHNLYEYFYR